MPKDSTTDQASERTPAEPHASHARLQLAGDFDSPQQVLASDNLSADKKREIFEVWLRDLDAQSSQPEATGQLIDEIRDAIARLAAEEEKPAR